MAGKRKAAVATSSTRSTKKIPWWNGWARFRSPVTRKGKPKTWKTRLLTFVKWSAISGLALVLVAVVGFVVLYRSIDVPDPNADFLTQTTMVYYGDGKTEIGEFAVQKRTSLEFQEMPQNIKDAVVAAENKTFWTDKGVSLKSIVRAAFSNAAGNSTQGGSTITQQYVKILYLNQERSYTRKIKEAILALKIQREQSKQEVLTGYLNDIYFGRGAYGIEAAAETYFGVHAKDMTLKQAAVLASVLNNPTQLDPANGKVSQRALHARYDYVLDNMVGLASASDGDTVGITQAQADQAKKKLPAFKKVDNGDTYGRQNGFMLTMVKQQLLGLRNSDTKQKFTDAEIDGGGLRITTTFTKTAMDAAAAGVKAQRPDGFSDKQLHVAVASVQPGTGAVRGFYAGQNFLRSQLNWAVAGGSSGSTFKPFALAAALQAGYSLNDTFDGNSPLTLADGTEINNEQHTSYGPAVTLLTGIEQSINTVFVDMTLSFPDGPEKIISMANKMGIPPLKTPKKDAFGFPDHTAGLNPDSTVALGSQTVSPINMANGYATLANKGVEADPYIIDKVTNADGKVLYQHQVVTHRAVSADIAADVSYSLQQTVLHGTGTAAIALGRPAAGKTGTATNNLDQVDSAWFAGYTPQLSTAVMYVRGTGVGQLDGWLPSYFGADYPARTWTDVMQRDMAGLDVEQFPPRANVDGTAPESGHVSPPPVTPTHTRSPSSSPTHDGPTTTSEPPTSEPPTTTSAPPTSAPPTSAPPTSGCGLLTTCPPTSAPPTSEPPTSPAGGESGAPAGRRVVLTATRPTPLAWLAPWSW